jgi:hypothetical protein
LTYIDTKNSDRSEAKWMVITEDIITQAIGVVVIMNILGDIIVFRGMAIFLIMDGATVPAGKIKNYIPNTEV